MAQSSLPGSFSRTNMSGTGRFDDKVLQFYARNYDLIVAGNLEPGKDGCRVDFCADVGSFSCSLKDMIEEAQLLTSQPERTRKQS
jgi:hypothetical protein